MKIIGGALDKNNIRFLQITLRIAITLIKKEKHQMNRKEVIKGIQNTEMSFKQGIEVQED